MLKRSTLSERETLLRLSWRFRGQRRRFDLELALRCNQKLSSSVEHSVHRDADTGSFLFAFKSIPLQSSLAPMSLDSLSEIMSNQLGSGFAPLG